MTGADINGRRITVELSKRAKPREPTPGILIEIQGDILGKRDLLPQEDQEDTEILIHDLVLQADRTGVTDIIVITTKKGDTDTTDPGLGQDQDPTEDTETETAIPDRLADDMYTSPTQPIINSRSASTSNSYS
jgi:hypothetical protein